MASWTKVSRRLAMTTLGAVLAGCTTTAPLTQARPAASPGPSPQPSLAATPGPSPTGATASPGAGTAFSSTVAPVTAADVPSSWRPGCPVGPASLRLLHLSYWGFDAAPHTGTMVVNAAVTADVVQIFRTLFRERFPIRQMQPVDAYGGDDSRSMTADNTSAFNCRLAVSSGAPAWSAHAYGEAIDVNTVENPYVFQGTVTPTTGASFVVRSPLRAGMAVPGGQLVAAFADAGWLWGGRWSDPDYQHFSKTGN